MADESLDVFRDCLRRARDGRQSRSIAVELLKKEPERYLPVALALTGGARPEATAGARITLGAWIRAKPQRRDLLLLCFQMPKLMPVDYRLLDSACRLIAKSHRATSAKPNTLRLLGFCIAAEVLTSVGESAEALRIASWAVRCFDRQRPQSVVGLLYHSYSLAVLSVSLALTGQFEDALDAARRSYLTIPKRGGGFSRRFILGGVLEAYSALKPVFASRGVGREQRLEFIQCARLAEKNRNTPVQSTIKSGDDAFLAKAGDRVRFERAQFLDLVRRFEMAKQDLPRHFREYLEVIQLYGEKLIERNRATEALGFVESGFALLADLSKLYPEQFRSSYFRELIMMSEYSISIAKELESNSDWLIRVDEFLELAGQLLSQNPNNAEMSDHVRRGRIHLLRGECRALRSDLDGAEKEMRLAVNCFRRNGELTPELAGYFVRAYLKLPGEKWENLIKGLVDAA